MRALELTGQVFGRLTVVERGAPTGGKSMWRCTCACGKRPVIRGELLKRGATRSCGCLRNERTAIMGRSFTKPQLDLAGLRFGKLVAVRKARTASSAGWLCMCDCGNEATVLTSFLRRGHTRSCGCLKVTANRGERHYRWRPDITESERDATRRGENKAWSRAVLERDGFTCQACGAGGDMHAHHLESYARYPDLRLEMTNGVTLCVRCHKDFHRVCGITRFTRDDFYLHFKIGPNSELAPDVA